VIVQHESAKPGGGATSETSKPMNTAVASTNDNHNNGQRKAFGFLTPEFILIFLGQIVAVVLAYSSIKSDVRDLNSHVMSHDEQIRELKAQRQSDHDLLEQVATDTKLIRQAIDQGRKP
jgi:hypothetical protein